LISGILLCVCARARKRKRDMLIYILVK